MDTESEAPALVLSCQLYWPLSRLVIVQYTTFNTIDQNDILL